jgi:hypothetical protein
VCTFPNVHRERRLLRPPSVSSLCNVLVQPPSSPERTTAHSLTLWNGSLELPNSCPSRRDQHPQLYLCTNVPKCSGRHADLTDLGRLSHTLRPEAGFANRPFGTHITSVLQVSCTSVATYPDKSTQSAKSDSTQIRDHRDMISATGNSNDMPKG